MICNIDPQVKMDMRDFILRMVQQSIFSTEMIDKITILLAFQYTNNKNLENMYQNKCDNLQLEVDIKRFTLIECIYSK